MLFALSFVPSMFIRTYACCPNAYMIASCAETRARNTMQHVADTGKGGNGAHMQHDAEARARNTMHHDAETEDTARIATADDEARRVDNQVIRRRNRGTARIIT